MSETERLREILYENIFYSPDGCWYWTARTIKKYGYLYFKGKAIRAHRLSYALHKGTLTNEIFVCHSCDNPTCVNPDHLWLGSHTDNIRDMIRKGRRSKKIPNPKLTPFQVVEIRESSDRAISLAARYSVSRKTINNIKSGSTWKMV